MSSAFAHDAEFCKLLAGESRINLVRLMLEISADAYPQLDWLGCLTEIDRLGQLACDRVDSIGPAAGLRDRLIEISRLLYEDEGFHGNREAYYDPRNSYLNEVLARRCGIPISLAVVYMAVAEVAGLATYGVAAPGHFVVGCGGGEAALFVDPFSQGEVLKREACRRRIQRILGAAGVVSDEHFGPAAPRDIAVRALRNLKTAYAMDNQWAAMLPVQKRLTLLLPEAPDEQRDLGLVYLRTGKAPEAIQLIEGYLRTCDQQQAQQVEPFLRTARRLQAELN